MSAEEVVVHKLDHMGREVLTYPARVLARGPGFVTVEATFQVPEIQMDRMTMRPGDRFVETFYSDRWYNVFAVYDGRTGTFKGWYCNIARPARIEAGDIYQEDLALDLLVYPEGHWAVQDEAEFERLPLTQTERKQARAALTDLVARARDGRPPFGRGRLRPSEDKG